MIFAYILGCLNGGYYYGKIVRKTDIRLLGSHNPGALNTLKVFGAGPFIGVFLIDFSKGSVATALAFYLDLHELAILGAMTGVVIGHIYPIQMRFKGGKGVAAFLGSLAVYDPGLLGVTVLLFLASFPVVRKFSITGLVALATLPLVAMILHGDGIELIFLVTLITLIIYRHTENIQDYVSTRFDTRK